jgi:hypothetical protein
MQDASYKTKNAGGAREKPSDLPPEAGGLDVV